jgi:hypothetical protein
MSNFAVVLVDKRTGEPTFEGERVHRNLPCPICAHLHRNQSWCLIDLRRRLVICPRVRSEKPIRSAGWLHSIDGSPVNLEAATVCKRSDRVVMPDMSRYLDEHRSNRDLVDASIELLAARWRLPYSAVAALAPGWDDARRRHLFPMYGRNAEGDWVVCGIRTRVGSKKAAIVGSRNGLLIPGRPDWPEFRSRPDRKRDLYIVEGESDLAAAISLGLQAIARPGCLAVEQQAVEYAADCDVVIVRDNDGPGREGAERLRGLILKRGRARSCVTISPPPRHKDLREWAAVCDGPAVVEAVTRGRRGF